MTGARRIRGRRGFTLIEMMATIVIVGMVLGFAVNFYQQLVQQTERALARSRETRQALSVLTRLASDLEAAYLLRKPEETDPLFHPWVFRATSSAGAVGADQVLFVTRNHRARTIDRHESDLAVVAYWLQDGVEGGYELMRWSSTDLQSTLRFERSDAEADAVLLADGIASFGLRFLSSEGEWTEEWDSSQIAESSELPSGIEITLSLLERDAQGFIEEELDEFGNLSADVDRRVYLRRVSIAVPPIDLAALLEQEEDGPGGQSGEDEEEGCWTVAGCAAEFGAQALSTGQFTQEQLDDLVASEGDLCVSDSSIAEAVAALGVCQ